jgi:hypothetical protein
MKINNRCSLSFLQPMIPWDRPVVFLGFSVSRFPVEILTAADSQPSDDLLCWDLGPLFPIVYIVNNTVAAIMGNPTSV